MRKVDGLQPHRQHTLQNFANGLPRWHGLPYYACGGGKGKPWGKLGLLKPKLKGVR